MLKKHKQQRIIDQIRLDKRIKMSNKFSNTYGLIIFVVFIIFAVCGLVLLKKSIINNADAVGYNKASDFARQNKTLYLNKVNNLDLVVFFSSAIFEKNSTYKDSNVSFEAWLVSVEHILESKQNIFEYNIYANLNGVIYPRSKHISVATKKIIDEAIREAVKHKNETIFVPHSDVFTNSGGYALAQTIGRGADAIIIDYEPKQKSLYNISEHVADSNNFYLNDSHNYYLIDNEGSLIYYYDNIGLNFRETQQSIYRHFKTLTSDVESIQNKKAIYYNTSDGKKMCAYVIQDPDTGWYSIATLPYDEVIADFNTVTYIFIILSAFLLLTQWIMLLREHNLSAKVEMSNEALKVVGNSYQAIIRINFKNASFSILKAPDVLRQQLGDSTDFRELKRKLRQFIHQDHLDSFLDNYSLSNMEHLSINKIRDTGHDYLVKFYGDQYKWYNIRLLFDESLDLHESILSLKLVDDEKIRENTERELLKNALQSAKNSEEAKQAFYSSMSHDMRTPLNGIIGVCTLARTHLGDPERMSDMLDKISSSSKALLHLVDEILEVAKPKIEQNLEIEACNLKEKLIEDLSIFTFTADQANKKFEMSIDITHENVKCDIKKIRQILNNLISNSLKYSEVNTVVKLSIKEMKVMGAEQFVFVVEDNGIGMSKEFLEKIFEPYSREETKKHVVGTGLGMPIVKNLISLMSGDIKIKSEQGVGTTVTVILPLEACEEQRFDQTEASINDQNAAFDLSGLKILLAEDNKLNMEIATELLEMRGVNLTQAWNGQEAVDKFSQSEINYFDAILMDIKMPILDGCQATMAIRKLDRADARSVPIIAVTANAFSEDISSTIAAGMDAHISKPIDFNVLLTTLNNLINKKKE